MDNVKELVAKAKGLNVPELTQRANEVEVIDEGYKNAILAARAAFPIVTSAFDEFEAGELSYKGFQTALGTMNSQLAIVQEHFNKLTQTRVELVFEVAENLPTG